MIRDWMRNWPIRRIINMRILLSLLAVLWFLSPDVAGAQQVSATREVVSKSHFSRPHDLVLSPDGKLLFVTDMANSDIKILLPESLKIVGAFGIGELNRPHDLVFAPDGRLFVADSNNDRVAIYKVSGAIAVPDGKIRGFEVPEGLDFGPGGHLYVANTSEGSVVKVDPKQNDKVVGRIDEAANAEFERPHDVDVDAHGLVHVSDPGNDRIVVLDENFKFIKEIKSGFNEPKYFGFDDKNRLYVADEYNNQLKIFDAELNLMLTLGDGKAGTENGRFYQPEGVAVRGDQMWVSDTYNDRILRYRLSFE